MKISAKWNPCLVVTGTLILFYVVLAFCHFLIPHSPDYTPTLVKPLEDSEFYLWFFNDTPVGRLVFDLASPILGFRYADGVLFLFWIVFSAASAVLLLKIIFLHRSKEPKNARIVTWAIVIAIGSVVFGHKAFNLANYLSFENWLSWPAQLEYLRSLIKPQGLWHTRFYQPALALTAVLAGVVCVHSLGNAGATLARLNCSLILAVSCWVMSRYPWVGMTFMAFLGLELLTFLRPSRFREKKYSGGVLLFSLILLGGLMLASFGEPMNPDFSRRILVEYDRMPDGPTFRSNLAILAASLLFRKSSLGRLVIKLQAANLLAVCSSLVTGITVSAWHYMYVVSVTIPLLVFLAGRALFERLTLAIGSNRALAGGLALMMIVGLYEQHIWFHGSHFLVPKGQVRTLERVQQECGPDKKAQYFFSTDVALYWSIPARTLCRNIFPMGWEDPRMSDKTIAARYLAGMTLFGGKSSREEFLNDLDLHLANLASEERQFTRDQVKYGTRDRFYRHSLWYLFHVGYNTKESDSYLRKLFKEVDFSEDLRVLRELADQGRILINP